MQSQRSLRLTLIVKNSKISLESVQRLKMRAPEGDRDPDEAPHSNLLGTWIDIKGPKKRPLYRRRITQIARNDVEIPSGNPEAPLKRVSAEDMERLFHIVVPYIEGGREVVLHEQQAPKNKKGKPEKVEHLRVDLTDINGDNSQSQKRK